VDAAAVDRAGARITKKVVPDIVGKCGQFDAPVENTELDLRGVGGEQREVEA
jgi:hypothetical protein